MTWPEPLTVTTRNISPRRFRAAVSDAGGRTVATVDCLIGPARCGNFGEMRIHGEDGAPRQRLRALVLLVRASLAHAAAAGVRHVETRAPARLAAFAERMTGFAGEPRADGTYRFEADLARVRTHAVDTTEPDGTLKAITTEKMIRE